MKDKAAVPVFELSFVKLEQALKQPLCAICRRVRETDEGYIWSLLYEFTGDPIIRGNFNEALGFCHYHAHLIVIIVKERELMVPSSVARMYETVVEHYKALLHFSEVGKKRSVLRWHKAHKMPMRGCMACANVKGLEEAELSALGRFLRYPAHRDVYQQSDGLCNHHLAQLLAKANQEVWAFLLRDHKQRLERLEKNLWQLQRKQSYDVHEAVTEEEAQSWLEAIWRFTGVHWGKLLIPRH
jgi:hypothetical protein